MVSRRWEQSSGDRAASQQPIYNRASGNELVRTPTQTLARSMGIERWMTRLESRSVNWSATLRLSSATATTLVSRSFRAGMIHLWLTSVDSQWTYPRCREVAPKPIFFGTARGSWLSWIVLPQLNDLVNS